MSVALPNEKRPWSVLGWLAAFLLALCVYSLTLAPSITLNDSGELGLACAVPGVAHPPGFPLYTLVGHLFAIFPVGEIAQRLNFMSAFFGAIAVGSVTMVVHQCLWLSDEKAAKRSKGAPQPAWLPLALGVAAGLTFAWSTTLWDYSTVTEVYTLGLALLASALAIVLYWARVYSTDAAMVPRWPLPLAGLLIGLALANHHVTALVSLPSFAVLILSTGGWQVMKRREFLIGVAALILACLAYAYLPIVARRDPVLNWGNPSTLERLFWHVSAKQYQSYLDVSGATAAAELRAWLTTISAQFTLVGLLLALAGLASLYRTRKRLFWFLVALLACPVAYGLAYRTDQDKEAYYLPSNLAVLAAAFVGVMAILRRLALTSSAAFQVAIAVMLALPVGQLLRNRSKASHRRDTVARQYVTDALQNVGPGGLLLSGDWQLTSAHLYMRHIEGFRADAIVVATDLLKRSWYVENYLKKQYPAMMEACSKEVTAYLEELDKFEHDIGYSSSRLNERYRATMNAFIRYQLERGSAAYLTLPIEDGVGKDAGTLWVPQGLTMRIVRATELPFLDEQRLDVSWFFDGSKHLDVVANSILKPTYARMIGNRGRYLGIGGKHAEAVERMATALQLDPAAERMYEFIGDIHATRGDRERAIAAYRKELEVRPANAPVAERLRRLLGQQ